MPQFSPTRRIRGRRLQSIRSAFLASNPLCVHCKRMGRIEAATEVDHIIPLYRGGPDAHENRQGLCDACHATKTAEDLAAMRPRGADVAGWPTDPDHPWNRAAGRPTPPLVPDPTADRPLTAGHTPRWGGSKLAAPLGKPHGPCRPQTGAPGGQGVASGH